VVLRRERELMARSDKEATVAELTEDFRSSAATVLTEYRGLTVASMKELRRSLGPDTKYSVVKNTLTKIAAKSAGVDLSDELLAGPSAVAFIKGDPIEAAKNLKNFQKENPLLVIKGGVFDGKAITAADIMRFADLESREVLLSKLAGAMKGTMAKAARTFDALRIKLEAGAPAAEAVVETEAVAEVAVAETEAVAESEAVAEEAVAETEAVAEEAVAESEAVAEEAVAETEAVAEEAVAEEAVAETEAVAEEAVAETEAVAEEAVAETEAVVEEEPASE
jgi:large subunit ribosomal protein L10